MIRALLLAFTGLAGVWMPWAAAFAQEPAPRTDAPTGEAAAAAPQPRAWNSMAPEQQKLLHGYQDTWDSLPPERQQALAKGSQRWLTMTPEQRAGAQQRFSQWRAMPPEQRQLLRQRWQQFKALPPERQQRVREQFNRFRQMPLERRQQLRQQWRQMTPEQRRSVIQRPSQPHAAPPHPAPRRNPR